MKRLFSKQIKLKLLWQLLAYGILCGGILGFSLYVQPGPVGSVLGNMLREPRIFLVNLFPVAVLLGLLWALLGNLFYAGSLTNLLVNLLSIVNLIKMECRNDPLVPDDFALLGEALVATGDYRLNLHVPLFLMVAAGSLALVLLGLKLKTPGKVWLRIGAGLLVLALFVGAMLTVYPSKELYNQLVATVPELSTSYVPAVFRDTGFLYCFLHNVNLYAVDRPEGYSRARVEEWNTQTAQPAPDGPLGDVNLIFIQCEAFTDLYDREAFTYAPEENPAWRYHLVAEGDQAISGHIVVSNFGAGTANTEYDVITGVQTNMLGEVVNSAFRTVHKKMASLCRTYQAQGYEEWFMHPGVSWFYNRESVYDRMGFRSATYGEDFDANVYAEKGGFTSDAAFGKRLLEQYEAHKAESEAPWFAFTVTIQNHQSYPYSKYSGMTLPPVQTDRVLSDAAMESLTVYAEGIRDSSRLLLDLTEYFDEETAPTLVIFWGDHLPALGAGYQIYQEVGLDVGNEADPAWTLDTYTTPFTIWANRAYCHRYDLDARARALELPADGRISDIYLGELVYELTDMEGTDAYFDYLAQARRILPVICRDTFSLPDGTITRTLTPEQQAVVDRLRQWCYYRAAEQKIGEMK